ncbi:hypothetical protein MTTB_13370 [Methanothermobacter tenebrarum]|jgi:2-polyprenyl-3-methyl-5-hydroxy-6-metoxy-1,4-benzoquinol methylase|uniref:Class I SAM-dependent methyltransferase n=1 Tax=Methanothermobacter tenebrarum TaxID=680118 RepID=A0ABM7YF17_9EURY|nr:class I SAM-dependent methyltransferase [Methanothermobacter tenebrarum]MDX9692848.1 class I SAM-dependent methyltransferase [Methanothermobacter sp.]BDH79958.1 hypothetical protein MTTB_13370 [Methanothermobacter tenebrarum]HOQ19755.1 class I SAM-dependent methyltransferase [Methanothermobacter sp.]
MDKIKFKDFEETIEKIVRQNLVFPEELEYYELHKERIFYGLNLLLNFTNWEPTSKVLDVGSAPGYASIFLKKLGYDVRGVNYITRKNFKERMNRMSIPIDVCNIDSEQLPYKKGEFDLVVFFEVIEHLLNPHHALNEIYKVLRDEGVLILSTPNLSKLSNRIRLLAGKSINPEETFLRKCL